MSSPATSKPAVFPSTLSLIDLTTYHVVKQYTPSQHTIHIGRGSKSNSACHSLSSGLFRSHSTKVMSQTHAIITWNQPRDGKSDKANLTDQGSTNGTFLQKAGEKQTFRLKASIGYEINTDDIITFGKAMGRSSSGSPAYDPIRLRASYLPTNPRRAIEATPVPVLDLTTDESPFDFDPEDVQPSARQLLSKQQLLLDALVVEEDVDSEMRDGGRFGYGITESELMSDDDDGDDDDGDGTGKSHDEAMPHVSCIALDSSGEEESDCEVSLPGALSNAAWKNDGRMVEEYYSTSQGSRLSSSAKEPIVSTRVRVQKVSDWSDPEDEEAEEEEYFQEHQLENYPGHHARVGPPPSLTFDDPNHEDYVSPSLKSLDRFKRSCFSPIFSASVGARSPRSDSIESLCTHPDLVELSSDDSDHYVFFDLERERPSEVMDKDGEPETRGKFAEGRLSAKLNVFGAPTGFISRSSRLPSPVSPGTEADLDSTRMNDDYQTARDYLQSYNQPADARLSQLPSPLSSPNSGNIALSRHSQTEEEEGEEEVAVEDESDSSAEVVKSSLPLESLRHQQDSSRDDSDKEDSTAKESDEKSGVPWEDALGSDYLDEVDWEGRKPSDKANACTVDYWDEDADMPSEENEEGPEELLYWNDLAEDDECDDYYEHTSEAMEASGNEEAGETEDDEVFKATEGDKIALEEERQEDSEPSSTNFWQEFLYGKDVDEEEEASDESFELNHESRDSDVEDKEEVKKEEFVEELKELQKEQEESGEDSRTRLELSYLLPCTLEVNVNEVEAQSQAVEKDCLAAVEGESALGSELEVMELEGQEDNKQSSSDFWKEFLYGMDLDEEEEESDEDFDFEHESREDVEYVVEKEQEEIFEELEELGKEQEESRRESRKRLDPLPCTLEVNKSEEAQSQAIGVDRPAAVEEVSAAPGRELELEENRQENTDEPSSPDSKESLHGKDLDEEESSDADFNSEDKSGGEVRVYEVDKELEEIIKELKEIEQDEAYGLAAESEESACESESEVEEVETDEVEGEEEEEDDEDELNSLDNLEFLYSKDLDEEDDVSADYEEEKSVALSNLLAYLKERRAARQAHTLPDQSADVPALPESSEAIPPAVSMEQVHSEIEESVNVESVATDTPAAVEAFVPTVSNERNHYELEEPQAVNFASVATTENPSVVEGLISVVSNKRSHCEIEEPVNFASVATNTPAVEIATVIAPLPKRRRLNLKQVTLSTAVGFAAGIVATVVGLNALEGLLEGLDQQ